MAVSLRDPQDGDLAELSEINVTPFIDVMLVLLIIFMVAAPLSTVDVAVDLPVSSAPPQARPDKPIFLSVKPDLTLALGNDDVPRGTLQATLDRQTNNDRQQRIFLRADGVVAYRDLMGVMNLLRGAGYLKVALVGLEDTGQGSAIGGQLPGASSAAQQAAPAPRP
ncbi:biopolymer transporter [Bradyrhizobium jicamae]|uniref:Biopolymer transport protein ExbD n=1 Tax=Bradyrhizobium jicamae TaxID=280332 RepID=A0A0R3L4F7_9BRAD|nr:TonB system transport protein ExbD [Bradyrhizobium jicamae]KRR02791.1 biopolymer transporter [Bradyrhizobium jicamae]